MSVLKSDLKIINKEIILKARESLKILTKDFPLSIIYEALKFSKIKDASSFLKEKRNFLTLEQAKAIKKLYLENYKKTD